VLHRIEANERSILCDGHKTQRARIIYVYDTESTAHLRQFYTAQKQSKFAKEK